ncbi:accessory factor UbiK family protein [Acidithiobacillus acidisediminis]|jgi:hypothetical protein|uniref:accessory factor UbiK family protein n=1 Tax=Acidithiobacillus TaxID=119977 RepID=UPI00200CDA5E|nr:accessory factor UbiK family protein [Acidithiobacillus sp. S30A2]
MQRRIADEIAAAIGDAVARFGSVKEDLDKQLKTVISNALDRLDLVTREEFEIQQELNTRLAARVAALEERLAKLAGEDKKQD